MRNKNNNVYLPFIIGVSCAIGILIGSYLNIFSYTEFNAANASKNKLINLINYIEDDYVDEVNTDSIVNVTVTAIMENLDPHSVYISQEEYARVQENMKGQIVGIGVQFFKKNDSIAIVQTLPNSPAMKAGILPGDRIIKADTITLSGKNIPNDSITKVIKGAIDSHVQLQVKRMDIDSLLTFDVKRDIVPIKSIDAAFQLNDSTGFIKINRFSETTSQEFRHQLIQLKEQGTKSLIIDLRNNGGGYIKEAIAMADELLPKGTPILYTKSRKGKRKENTAGKKGIFEDGDLYILINEKSASASEIIAGAIQDNDRGFVVGRRSFGKGLVQREMKLGDGSAVRMTVSRYYTPTGRSIQRPYTNGHSKEYYDEFHQRFKSGELTEKDSIKVNDSLKFTTPKGRIVYGGGGIVPDIFVGQPQDQMLQDLHFMLEGGVMSNFVFDQLDQNRAFYNQLSRSDFEEQELVTDEMIEAYTQYLNQYTFEYDFEDYKTRLRAYLKSEMANQLFGNDFAEEIRIKNDLMLHEALQHLNSK
ncbi:MAG: S41 family peptidase [Bacteroidota bacterium]